MNETRIMREWRGLVARDRANEYESVLRATWLPEHSHTPGNRGVWLLRREKGDVVEFIAMTLWDSYEAIQDFAGDDVHQAHYYPVEERYVIDRPCKVVHYAVRWCSFSPEEATTIPQQNV